MGNLAINNRERFINWLRTLSDEKVTRVFELVANELITEGGKGISFGDGSQIELDDSGYVLLRYDTTADLNIRTGKTIMFQCGKTVLSVKISSQTTFSSRYFLAGDKIIIIGKIREDQCAALAVVNEGYYDMFRSYSSLLDKVHAIREYQCLPEAAQKNIAMQLSGERFPVTAPAAVNITSPSGLRLKFNMCRDTYTPQQQLAIEEMFEESKNLGSSNRQKALRRLSYILNIDQTTASAITMTKDEIIDGLNKYLYKMDAAKEKFAEAVVAAKYSNQRGLSVLLVGRPGVGKTSFTKAVSRVLRRPYFSIPLGMATSMVDIVGDAQHYDSSDCGEMVKNFYKIRTTAAVVGLDEYGQAANIEKEGGKVSKAFNEAISDEQYFKDVFLGTYINTSNTIFVATTNSTETIPENLLNRFVVIHIDDYTEEEKVEMANNYILPDILSAYHIERNEITISKENLTYIAENFCEDDGARDMKKHLKALVSKILSIWDTTGERAPVQINRKFIDLSLESYVDKTSPIIIYRRNKALYSPKVSEEIKSLIDKCRRDDLEASLREKYDKKLRYLVNLVPTGNAFAKFDEEKFNEQVNKTHYGLDDVKKSIAQIFYISSVMKKPLTSNRILLVGPPGIGKTSFVKSIAEACDAKYAKVSLNGISDDAVIKGHSISYIGADSGAVIKAAYSMKTTKGIIQLDEVDKMGTREGVDVSNTLIDLLDDSAEFTDSFLGVPVDFTNTLFIATANDISTINRPLLDRFTVIHLDGYTEREKEKIVEEYVIPKVISELCPRKLSLSFSDDVKKLLVTKYCRSLGVRDADRFVRELVKDKVYGMRNNPTKKAAICVDDVERVLGKPRTERGNFPCENYPGLARALAVTGDGSSMSFAIETMLLPEENTLTITGLPKESTIDSVKLAISYIKQNYPGVVTGRGIHVHFGEGAVVKDGPSAGVAILMSVLSAATDTPITEDISYTGEINGHGYIFNIGGVIEKIQAAEQSGCSKVVIPYGNFAELKQEDLKQFSISIIPVRHVSEVIREVFPKLESKAFH